MDKSKKNKSVWIDNAYKVFATIGVIGAIVLGIISVFQSTNIIVETTLIIDHVEIANPTTIYIPEISEEIEPVVNNEPSTEE